jgi:hypothetical protein
LTARPAGSGKALLVPTPDLTTRGMGSGNAVCLLTEVRRHSTPTNIFIATAHGTTTPRTPKGAIQGSLARQLQRYIRCCCDQQSEVHQLLCSSIRSKFPTFCITVKATGVHSYCSTTPYSPVMSPTTLCMRQQVLVQVDAMLLPLTLLSEKNWR